MRGAARGMGIKGNGSQALARNLNSMWISPYLSEGLEEWISNANRNKLPIYLTTKGVQFQPFEASLFRSYIGPLSVLHSGPIYRIYFGAQFCNCFLYMSKTLQPKPERHHSSISDYLNVCRHTYCSNMAKSGMNPKTLQYLMGHSDISVTMNVYTHIGLDDAEKAVIIVEKESRIAVNYFFRLRRLPVLDNGPEHIDHILGIRISA